MTSSRSATTSSSPPRFLDHRDPRPHATIDDLHRAAARASGRGALRARTSALLTRVGAESPAETRLRLLLQRAGLPEPELGGVLHDIRGDRIGWFDLVYRPYRVAVEYDGDQHRTSVTQYDRDIRRFDRAHESRWTVVRVRSRGLTHEPRDTIRRVREALRRGGWAS